jgi:hypothetical protein
MGCQQARVELDQGTPFRIANSRIDITCATFPVRVLPDWPTVPAMQTSTQRMPCAEVSVSDVVKGGGMSDGEDEVPAKGPRHSEQQLEQILMTADGKLSP